jgi:DNA-binding PadR family transcriptional regulator
MKLENILLGVLLQHPSTGYDLKKFLDTSGRFLRSNTQMSQVYRSLTRMEELGWVVHTVETRPGQDAKTYRVTEEGATVFPDFMARLSFAGFMEIDEVIALLDTELDARHAQIARYRFRDRTLPAADTSVPFDQTLAEAVGEWGHQAGVRALDLHLAACQELRRQLLDGEITTQSVATVAAHAPETP